MFDDLLQMLSWFFDVLSFDKPSEKQRQTCVLAPLMMRDRTSAIVIENLYSAHHNWLSKFGWSLCLLMILISIQRHSRLNPLRVWLGLNSHRLTVLSCRPMHRGNHRNFVHTSMFVYCTIGKDPKWKPTPYHNMLPVLVCSFPFVLVGTKSLKDVGLGLNPTFLGRVHGT